MQTSLSIHDGKVVINGVELQTVTDLEIHARPAEQTRVVIEFDVTNLDADFSESVPQPLEKQ